MYKLLRLAIVMAVFVMPFSNIPTGAVISADRTCIGLFPDTTSTNTLCPYIEYLYQQGIVGGYSDGNFHPNDLVTRAQFAKMVVNAFNLGLGAGGDAGFSDVPSTNKFYHEINTLKAFGIINGYSDGTFRPDDKVSRGAALKFIVNAAKVADGNLFPTSTQNITSVFKDVASTHVFAPFIRDAYSAGSPAVIETIVSGYSDGTFKPDLNMTRAQVAKVITNSMKYAGTEQKSCSKYFCQDLSPRLADGTINGNFFQLNYDKLFWTIENDDLLNSSEDGYAQYSYLSSGNGGQSVTILSALDMTNPEDPNTTTESIFATLASMEGKTVNEYFGNATIEEMKKDSSSIGSGSMTVKNSYLGGNGMYRSEITVKDYDYMGQLYDFDGYIDLGIKRNGMFIMVGLTDNSANLPRITTTLNSIVYK